MEAKEIGSFLSDLRKQRGLKQKEVAEILHVSDKAVSRWETGKGIPDVSSLQGLSDYYEVSINEILAGKHFMQEDLKKEADQNVKEFVRRASRLKKKLCAAVAGIAVLLIMIILLAINFMPISGNAVQFFNNPSSMDKLFQYVSELEQQHIRYKVTIHADEQKIMIQSN